MRLPPVPGMRVGNLGLAVAPVNLAGFVVRPVVKPDVRKLVPALGRRYSPGLLDDAVRPTLNDRATHVRVSVWAGW